MASRMISTNPKETKNKKPRYDENRAMMKYRLFMASRMISTNPKETKNKNSAMMKTAL